MEKAAVGSAEWGAGVVGNSGKLIDRRLVIIDPGWPPL